jgi:hypothetical protein
MGNLLLAVTLALAHLSRRLLSLSPRLIKPLVDGTKQSKLGNALERQRHCERRKSEEAERLEGMGANWPGFGRRLSLPLLLRYNRPLALYHAAQALQLAGWHRDAAGRGTCVILKLPWGRRHFDRRRHRFNHRF